MKHPLCRFVAVGLLLFGVDVAWTGLFRSTDSPSASGSWSDEDVLVHEALSRGYHRSDPVVRRRLARNLRFAFGDDGRTDAALVEEAINLGMHRSDTLVRRRLVQKLRLLAQEDARAVEPTDAELRTFLARHVDRFRGDDRVRLTQVFFRDAAAAAAHAPSEETRPVALGEALPLPRDLPPLSRRELARRFGVAFADAAFAAAPGRWLGPVRSSFGHHWIRVHAHSSAGPVAFEVVRPTIREALLRERAELRMQRQVETLRTRFGVENAS